MTRFRRNVTPLLTFFILAWGMSAFGQDLFTELEAKQKEAPLTEEQKAAGEKESIF